MRSSPKPPVRFPLTMGLRYQTKTEHATVTGTSTTKWIGSRLIAFAANEDIRKNTRVQIAIEWPCLLDDHVRLQLSIDAIVTGVEDGIAEAVITQYDFRTRKEQEPAPGSSHFALLPFLPTARVLTAGAATLR